MGAKGDTKPLHLWNEFAGIGEVLGAVKDHVLEKVSDSTLIIALHQGSGGDVQPHANSSRRLLIA